MSISFQGGFQVFLLSVAYIDFNRRSEGLRLSCLSLLSHKYSVEQSTLCWVPERGNDYFNLSLV